jgi:hypothetical protein
MIFRQNGYIFPHIRNLDVHFYYDSCKNCNIKQMYNCSPVDFCSRCNQDVVKIESSFPEFDIQEEIRVCQNCYDALSAPVKSNQAFRKRIEQLIKG